MGKFKIANHGAILRITGGPYAGREFALTGEEISLGRSAGVEITVPDNLLSRVHARLYRDQGQWLVEDHDSKNGTFLDEERIEVPAVVLPGHQVRLGKTIFELDYGRDEEAASEFDETMISYRARPMTATSFDGTSPTLAGGEKELREQKQLGIIYKLQSILTRGGNEQEMYEAILEQINAIVPADNACLLLYDSADDSLVPVAERDEKGSVPASGAFISRSIVEYVKGKGEAILSLDAQRDERFLGESVSGLDVRSVMSVPMLGHNSDLHGIIYVISRRKRKTWGEDDLRLMTSIAYSAGMAVANIRLLQRSVQAERMATIGSTAASLSHYIKNILTGLEGSVSLLRMGIDSSDTEIMNEAWDILANNQKFLSSLVLDMLSLAREEPLELAQYNLTETVIEAVDLIRNRADQDNIRIELNESVRDTHLLATIDARAVHRVVMNVINHSVERTRQEHGRSGDGIVTIDMVEDIPGDLGIIEISDNSGTLTSEQMDSLFSDLQDGQSGRGTGLGLVVAQRLIRQHQGELVVSNRKELGVTMTIRLPLRREYQENAGTAGHATPAS